MMKHPAITSMIFGPLLIIIGLWMLIKAKAIVKVMASFKHVDWTVYSAGAMNIFFGLFILSQYNVWTWGAGFFLTLLGWVFLIRGIIMLFAPEFFLKVTYRKEPFLRIWGVVLLIWGLLISKAAFLLQA